MKKFGLATLLVALAAGASVALRPLSAEFPSAAPLMFLLAIALVARYVGFREGIFALCVSALPVGIFFRQMPQESSLGMAVGKTIGFSLLCVSVCFLMRSLREAQANRARLAAIVDYSDDAIVSLGLDGEVTSWNAAATQMYGFGPTEMIG